MAVEEQETDAAEKFTWRIKNISKLKASKLYSETFWAGGQTWMLVAYIREDSFKDCVISLFLRCCSNTGARLDGTPPDRYAKYVFSVTISGTSLSLLGEGERHFNVGGKGWGFKDCIKLYSGPDPPYCVEHVVDDALVIHAHVISTEQATPDFSGYDQQEEDYADTDDKEEDSSADSDYDFQGEDSSDADTDQEADTSADSDDDPQEEDSLLSSDADTDQEEDTLDADADETDHTTGPDHQPKGASIEGATNHDLSGQKLAAGEAPGHQLQVGFPEPSTSRARLTPSNLIAQLSTMTSCINTKSPASENGSTLLLQQQRETMARYLSMPLEAIHKTDSFEDVEQIANLIADHPSSSEVDKATLMGLLSELKEGVPSTMSTVESSHVAETSMAWMAEDLEARLFHRHKQLGCLKDEVCRLAGEEKKLEGEIQQVTARKDRVGDRKKSTADELEKASREAWEEMEEMKETSGKRKRASEDRLAAEEKLDRLKTSWKALKLTLGL